MSAIIISIENLMASVRADVPVMNIVNSCNMILFNL